MIAEIENYGRFLSISISLVILLDSLLTLWNRQNTNSVTVRK